MTIRDKIILLVVSTGILFEALDIAIVNLAMPLIQQEFVLTSDTVQWTQTLYILFYGGFLIIGGKMADIVGRKKIFMLGSGIFLATSLGAGLSPGFDSLLLCRAFQGLGAALVIPSSFSIVTNTFVEPQIRNKAIGIFGSFAAIGSGSGLALGGLIATYFGWKWIFFINVPVIGIAMILSQLYIPSDRYTKSDTKPDVLSGVVLTSMVLIVTYLIHEVRRVGEYPLMFTVLFFSAIAMGAIFLLRARRPNALIQFSLFKKREPVTAYAVMLCMGAFFSGYLFLIAMVLQLQVGLSAARSGLVLLPFSVLSAIVSKAVLPGLLKRISIWPGAILGMSLMTLGGCGLLAGVHSNGNMILLMVSAACVTGTGIAVCFMTLNVLAVRQIPEENHGLATSLGTTAFFLGGGLGLGLIGMAMQFFKGFEMPSSLLSFFAALGVVILAINYPRQRVIDTPVSGL